MLHLLAPGSGSTQSLQRHFFPKMPVHCMTTLRQASTPSGEGDVGLDTILWPDVHPACMLLPSSHNSVSSRIPTHPRQSLRKCCIHQHVKEGGPTCIQNPKSITGKLMSWSTSRHFQEKNPFRFHFGGKTVFFKSTWEVLAGAKTRKKLPTKIFIHFFEPAHPSKCHMLILVPVPVYVNLLCCEGKCVI